jgi:hypothetical protein
VRGQLTRGRSRREEVLFAVVFGVVGGGFIVSLLAAFVGAVILLWEFDWLRRAAPSVQTEEARAHRT